MNSCSDERPINTGAHGCSRCNEIITSRYEKLKLPAARYQFLATCKNEQALDIMAEELGKGHDLDVLVDALMKECECD